MAKKKRTRKYYTQEEKLKILNEYNRLRAEGLEVSPFFNKMGLWGSTVSRWQRKMKAEVQPKPQTTQKTPTKANKPNPTAQVSSYQELRTTVSTILESNTQMAETLLAISELTKKALT